MWERKKGREIRTISSVRRSWLVECGEEKGVVTLFAIHER